MRAAILRQTNQPLVVEEIDYPEPPAGHIRVRLKASGVCHSDWHVLKGEWGDRIPVPVIMGHEGSGVVDQVGEGVTGLALGDHVVLSWRSPCGHCETCLQGWPSLCECSPLVGDRARVDGGPINQMVNLGSFATHTVVPEVAAVAIDPAIDFEVAALVGCGVATGVGAAINTACVTAGSSVAVFGCGGVGLNIIQGARLAGATQIIAVDKLAAKLELARRFGATNAVVAGAGDPVAAIMDLTDGRGVHFAFEAIGVLAEPFVQSVRCTRQRGTTVWVGHAPVGTPVPLDARDLIQEKTVMGCMYGSCRPRIDFPRLLNLYQQGRLMLDELITHRFSLDEINDAFACLAAGEVARSIIVFED